MDPTQLPWQRKAYRTRVKIDQELSELLGDLTVTEVDKVDSLMSTLDNLQLEADKVQEVYQTELVKEQVAQKRQLPAWMVSSNIKKSSKTKLTKSQTGNKKKTESARKLREIKNQVESVEKELETLANKIKAQAHEREIRKLNRDLARSGLFGRYVVRRRFR